MALLNMECWEGGTDPGWNPAPPVSTTRARTGTQSLKTATAEPKLSITPSGTVVVGFAMYLSVGAVTGNLRLPGVWGDGGTVLHSSLGFDAANHLQLRRSSSPVIATSSQVFPLSEWHYVEYKANVADTGGTVIVRVDGVEWINFSGDTRNAGVSTNIDAVSMSEYSGSVYIDDFYICNTTGTANNDFLGDHRVDFLLPNGNGAVNQWTGSDGNSTDNYLLVDETPVDTADYVYSSTVGNRDLYAFADLSAAVASIKGIQQVSYAQKSDAGAANLINLLRLADGTVDQSPSTPLSSSWASIMGKLYETKPDGSAWTVADLNGAQFGAEVG